MIKLYKNNLRFWTNGFFLIPLFFSLYLGLWWYAVVAGISTFLSILYHANDEQVFKRADIFFAWLIMGFNAYLLVSSGFNNIFLSLVDVVISVFSIIVFLNQTKANYNTYHSLYHVLAAGICLFSLLLKV